MRYYEEVIQEIRSAMEAGDLETAAFLLKREFSMPYIPSDTEAELKQLNRDLRYLKSEKKDSGEVPLEKLLHMLKGKPVSQLKAADLLCERNLRSITKELREWLSRDPLPEAAALIMEGLAEQAVSEEFTYRINGMEYEFYGDAIVPVAESEGFQEAMRILEEKFMKEPSLLELARTVLVSSCYMALPMSYEKEDGMDLAQKAERQVREAMMPQEENRKES